MLDLFSPPSDQDIVARQEIRVKELMKKHKTDNAQLAYLIEKCPDMSKEAMRQYREARHNLL